MGWYDRKYVMEVAHFRETGSYYVLNSAIGKAEAEMDRRHPGISSSFRASVSAPCNWKKYDTEWRMLIWELMLEAEPNNPEVIEFCKPYFLMNEISDHIAELDESSARLDDAIKTSEREFNEALAQFDRKHAIAERELKIVERELYEGLVEAGKLLPQESKLDKIRGFFRR